MWLIKIELFVIFLVLLILLIKSEFRENSNLNFKNEYVVRFQGSSYEAELLANELGYAFKGPVIGFSNTYIFISNSNYKPSLYQKRSEHLLTKRLSEDKRVVWVEKQEYKSRQKRDLEEIHNENIYPANNKEITRPKRQNFVRRHLESFNDVLWSHQWYLQDTRTRTDLPKLDLNVLPVYKLGVTGKNIRVTILDDGLEHTHEDLRANYDPNISWDCNDNDDDPSPRYSSEVRNSHGTRCAGEVAMTAGNGICGVGIAFNARIGGVRMLDGYVNDLVEGTALGYASDLVDIYSASWGPNDDGATVEAPGRLAQEAIERGITQGRNGRGSIYIWASGNGGKLNDNCNCDGYIASPYTVAIGSASESGSFPWYGEQCASMVGVTYSSGAYTDQMIATTDLNNTCTIKHTGTSASAPLAAGIIALVLETNPYLTWRDIQHLIIWTSEHLPVSENPGWSRNSAGLWFNTRFGFGLMNAYSMVITAANWTNVPDKQICKFPSERQNTIPLQSGQKVFMKFDASNCIIKYLEHVEITVNIEYSFRGDLEIFLVSPTGTKVQILGKRIFDQSTEGFKDWTFMSLMTWGENPSGIWTLEIIDQNKVRNNFGSIGSTRLNIHGTETIPNHMIDGPRNYEKYHAEKEKLWIKNKFNINDVNNNYNYNYWNMQ